MEKSFKITYGLWLIPVVLIPFSTDPCCSDAETSGLFSPLPNYLSPPFHIFLPPSHFASGLLVVMESLVSPCELLSLMSLLSHTPYQINRLHQPITTQTRQPGPRQTHRLTSLHQQSQSVIDKT